MDDVLVGVVKRQPQQTKILEQSAACRQEVRGGLRNALIVGAAGVSVTQRKARS